MNHREQRLTEKQEKLARERIQNPTASLRELGIKSGYKSAQHVYRELDKPHVQARIAELMRQKPTTDLPHLLKKIEEGLSATKVQNIKGRDGSIEVCEYPDYATRLLYIEIALALHGISLKAIKPDSPPSLIKILQDYAQHKANENRDASNEGQTDSPLDKLA